MPACVVIGSGPAGVACADALLEQGRSVIMLDVGRECDPERMTVVRAMRERDPEDWDPEWPSMIGPKEPGSVSGASRKLVYGSDFPYVDDEVGGLVQDGVRCAQSWARGGLSNVWGAAMLPYSHADTSDWPIAISALSPHYRAIAELTALSGTHDLLDDLFEVDYPLAPPAIVSAQAQSLLGRLGTHREKLRQTGFTFGRSRLAIHACKGCQLCLSGCPYDLIFRSEHVLLRLQKNPNFQYFSGHLVDEVRHDEQGVSALCAAAGGGRKEVRGSRAFLAAGVIGTAKILVKSLRLEQLTFHIQYHPYFLLPIFLLNSSGRPDREKLHTLAQIFLEMNDSKISEHMIHLQLYTYNPILRDRLRAIFGCAPLLSRFAVVQGYLHSSEAEPIMAHASVDRSSGRTMIALRGGLSRRAVATMAKVRRKLARHSLHLGFVPLPFMMQIGTPGDGNHIGGTFPMAKVPGVHTTDTLGRPKGYPRLHIVDASVLPSLAATTLTFTAMANARRIGIEAGRMEVGTE